MFISVTKQNICKNKNFSEYFNLYRGTEINFSFFIKKEEHIKDKKRFV